MSTDEKAEAAIETIQKLLEDLEAIAARVRSDLDHQTAHRRLDRWKSRTIESLNVVVGAKEATRFNDDTRIRSASRDLVGNVTNAAIRYKASLTSLIEELESHPEVALSQVRDRFTGAEADAKPSGGDVRQSTTSEQLISVFYASFMWLPGSLCAGTKIDQHC